MPPTPKKTRGRPKKIRTPQLSVPSTPIDKTEYFLELHVGGRIYFGNGLSMLEALNNLEQPQKIVSKGLLKIRVDSKERERPMQIFQMKRLFYPLSKVIIAKQLEAGF